MKLKNLLKVAYTNEIEVRFDHKDGDFEIFNDPNFIMGVGFSIYNDAKVISVTPIGNTLCIEAEVE